MLYVHVCISTCMVCSGMCKYMYVLVNVCDVHVCVNFVLC